MASIMSKLRSLKKAGDYQVTIPEIEAEIGVAQAHLESLVASRGAAFFDMSEAEQAKLDGEIREAGLRARNMELALAEAKKRRDLAEKAEAMANLEGAAKQAVADAKAAAELRREFVNTMHAAVTMRAEHKEISARLDAFRATASKAGRSDLKPPPDKIQAAFAAKNWPLMHPVDFAAFEQPFRGVAHFLTQLEELGIEA